MIDSYRPQTKQKHVCLATSNETKLYKCFISIEILQMFYLFKYLKYKSRYNINYVTHLTNLRS